MALVLAANAGSSSLKIALYTVGDSDDKLKLIVNSSISSISSPPANFSFEYGNNVTKDTVDVIHDHATAFAHFLARLQSEASIERRNIRYICHRVVHGGDYTRPVQITAESYHHIEELSNLAPLYVAYTILLTLSSRISQT